VSTSAHPKRAVLTVENTGEKLTPQIVATLAEPFQRGTRRIRADQRSFSREHVDLSLIAEEAAETLLPLAEKRGLTIETSGDTTPTIGSHALLLQLSTNLVHNAIVHNLPEQGTVSVTTGVQASAPAWHGSGHGAPAESFAALGTTSAPSLASRGVRTCNRRRRFSDRAAITVAGGLRAPPRIRTMCATPRNRRTRVRTL
jgi:hypothetical protein